MSKSKVIIFSFCKVCKSFLLALATHITRKKLLPATFMPRSKSSVIQLLRTSIVSLLFWQILSKAISCQSYNLWILTNFL